MKVLWLWQNGGQGPEYVLIRLRLEGLDNDIYFIPLADFPRIFAKLGFENE